MKMAELALFKIKRALSKYLSLSICYVCLALPYTAREIFIFLLHFIFNTLSVKVRFILNLLFNICVVFLMLPVYFFGFFLAWMLKKVFSSHDKNIFLKIDLFAKENILRRY